MLASEFFPAWYLGRNPIALRHRRHLRPGTGRRLRPQGSRPDRGAGLPDQVFPGCGLKGDSQSAQAVPRHAGTARRASTTEQDGAYFAAGIGGPLTGRGAHLLLIDDPVKNREEAESPTIRQRNKDWYTSDRLHPPDAERQDRHHPDALARRRPDRLAVEGARPRGLGRPEPAGDRRDGRRRPRPKAGRAALGAVPGRGAGSNQAQRRLARLEPPLPAAPRTRRGRHLQGRTGSSATPRPQEKLRRRSCRAGTRRSRPAS